jgi:hypothetical protein
VLGKVRDEMLGECNDRDIDEPPTFDAQAFGLRERLALNLLDELVEFVDTLFERGAPRL